MTTGPWLDDTESRAWRGYLRMQTLLTAELARQLVADAGLSLADYEVLVILSETPERRLRMFELGAQLLWEKSRLSHHITRMQGRGLVRREDCASDARGAFVVITDQGLAAITEAAPAHVANVRRVLFDHLSDDEVRLLGNVTHRIADHLTESTQA